MSRSFTLFLACLLVIASETFGGRRRDQSYYLDRWSSNHNLHVNLLSQRQPQSSATLPVTAAPPSRTVALDDTTKTDMVLPAPLRQESQSLALHQEAGRTAAYATSAPLSTQVAAPSNMRNSTRRRDARFFPLFAFVTINNSACTAASGDNGTCYTSGQCANLGGSASGTCANGYGTCCVFQKTCGETSNNNCTYFVNTNYPKTFNGVSSCQLTINKKSANVCQLRLDFDIFMISQPEANDHVCLNDRFTVSGGDTVPTICGTNTGNHMYVNLGPGTTTPSVLTFVTMGPDFDRKWKVKVTQIPCNTDWTPPPGCLQYFQGVTGKIKTYNYDTSTGLQLSNQDYSMCIRTEKNFCGIQYQACTDAINTDSQAFTITGNTNNPIGSRVGASSCTTDWVTIPCVSDNAQDPFSNCQDRLCGDNINVVQSTSAGNVVVYSYVRPFRIFYHTDSAESSSTPSESGNRGFCLDFVQQPCA